jgi:hypothetical protein
VNRSALKQMIWHLFPVDALAKAETKRESRERAAAGADDETCLKAAVKWLCRAQDQTPDGGVARAFKAAKYQGHGKCGWQAPYPETTGYIIPTFFALSDHFGDPAYDSRALRMADWESDIQMENGAVMGSVVTAPRSPAVFNTGQVVFGWLEAWRRSGRDKYLKSAVKAGDYLVSVQGEDGTWARGDSRFALKGATTYNARVAWALIELGLATGSERFIKAGRLNIEHAVSKQKDNGWFADNCLNDPERPLLHTIAYASRGVLEAGILLSNADFIAVGMRTLDALLTCQRTDGGLPGRLRQNWSSAAEWDCVTGDAQVAVAWLRAHSMTGDRKYFGAARAAVDFVKRTQNREHPEPGLRGGVKGSFPFDGPYGQFELLNWAAKFFCDALMMVNDHELAAKGIKG